MDILLNLDKFFSEKKDVGFKIPLTIVLIYTIVGTISAIFSIRVLTDEMLKNVELPEEIMMITYLFTPISVFAGVFLNWILVTAILYVLSALLGGKGQFLLLMKFVAFSFIPPILLSPVSTYLTIEFFKYPIQENLYSLIVLSMAVAFWQYFYWVFAVKNARDLSLKKSAVVSAVLILISLAFATYPFLGTPITQ